MKATTFRSVCVGILVGIAISLFIIGIAVAIGELS